MRGGSHVVVEGRRCGSDSQFKYTWQAGIVLVFNEGDCPKFDVGDQAFLDRMLVAPMRSRFADEADAHAGETQWTFPVNKDQADSFPDWMSALADVLLERCGSQALQKSRSPDEMKQWKQEIEGGVNPVAEWLEAVVQVTGDRSDFVLVKDLKENFEAQAERGFKLQARLLVAKLRSMRATVNSEAEKVKVGDKIVSARNVARGVKLQE